MNRILFFIIFIVIFVVGYWLISPLFIDKEAGELIEDIMVPGVSTLQEILSGKFVAGDVVHVKLKNNHLAFSKTT